MVRGYKDRRPNSTVNALRACALLSALCAGSCVPTSSVATGAVAPGVQEQLVLTKRAEDNLVAYSKLLGYVRHFHPSDEVAAADWERVAVTGLTAVEQANSAEELAKVLERLFKPYAPTIRVFVTGTTMPEPKGLSQPSDRGGLQTVSWLHVGFGGGLMPKERNVYSSTRNFEDSKGDFQKLKILERDLGAGVSCAVPMTLFARGGKSLPTATLRAEDPSDSPRSARFGAVALCWNVFQHFYPYFDVVKVDWNKELRTALASAATAKDNAEFLTTLKRLVGAAADGHGQVMHPFDMAFSAPPVNAVWVGEKLVVARVAPGTKEVAPGDVIEKINGESVGDLWTKFEPLISGATVQWRRHRAIQEMFRGAPGSELTLTLDPGKGAVKDVTLKRDSRAGDVFTTRESVEELKPGIWYVNIDANGVQMDEYEGAVEKLARAKGIVFDLRGYPNDVAHDIVYRISPDPVSSAKFETPLITLPDHEGMSFEDGAWPPTGPRQPMFKGKIAFIVTGQCISYAESIMGIVEHYKLGEIVGEATAGTNGNVNPFSLPGGFRVVYTGMRVRKHDGSTHHGVGVRPTIPVKPTIAGLRAGRDELLERALEAVGG